MENNKIKYGHWILLFKDGEERIKHHLKLVLPLSNKEIHDELTKAIAEGTAQNLTFAEWVREDDFFVDA